MADRLFVPYKTSSFRCLEIALIAAVAVGSGLIWQSYLPMISPSYLIAGLLAAGFLIIPRLGNMLAARRGAPLMTVAERNRRYLAELGLVSSETARSDYWPSLRPAVIRRPASRPRPRRRG